MTSNIEAFGLVTLAGLVIAAAAGVIANALSGKSSKGVKIDGRHDMRLQPSSFGGKMLNIFAASVSTGPAPLPYDELSQLLRWEDPKSIPSAEQLDQNVICIEYTADNEHLLIEWAEKTSDVAYDNEVPFDVVVVMADYSRLEGTEVTRLITAFDKAGVLFAGFRDNCKNFADAAKAFNEEIERSFQINRRRDTGLRIHTANVAAGLEARVA